MVKRIAAPTTAPSNKTLTLHPYATKCPFVKRTGNATADEDNESKTQLLREVISACLADLNHVGPLFNKLRERQTSCAASDDLPFRSV